MGYALVANLGCCLGLYMIAMVHCQDDFVGPIICYSCIDRAYNTTCGEPRSPEEAETLPTIECKRGACVKWTYYKNNQLLMHRTCSEKMNMRIALNTVCRTERNGNGYLCMCAKDNCNGGRHLVANIGTLLIPLLIIFSLTYLPT